MYFGCLALQHLSVEFGILISEVLMSDLTGPV